MATSGDARCLADFRLAPLVEGGAQLSVSDADRFMESFPTWMAANQSTHVPFLAEADSSPVGAAWLMLAERIPSPERRDPRWCGDVQSVYVVPDARRRGVGTALLRAVLAEARRLQLEHVTVHSNDQATPLYQRVGFMHDVHWLSWNPVA